MGGFVIWDAVARAEAARASEVRLAEEIEAARELASESAQRALDIESVVRAVEFEIGLLESALRVGELSAVASRAGTAAVGQRWIEEITGIERLLTVAAHELEDVVGRERDATALARVTLERLSSTLRHHPDVRSIGIWPGHAVETALGAALLAVERPDLASVHLHRVLAGPPVDDGHAIDVELMLSTALLRCDRLIEAIDAAQRAASRAHAIGDPVREVDALAMLGMLHALAGRTDDAAAALRSRVTVVESIDSATTAGSLDARATAHIELAAVLADLGKSERASEHARLAVELNPGRDHATALRVLAHALWINAQRDEPFPASAALLSAALEAALVGAPPDHATLEALVRLDGTAHGPLDARVRPLLLASWDGLKDGGRLTPVRRRVGRLLAELDRRHGRDSEADFWELAIGEGGER